MGFKKLGIYSMIGIFWMSAAMGQAKKSNPDLGVQLKKADEINPNALRINLSPDPASQNAKETKKETAKTDPSAPNADEMSTVLAMFIDNIKKASLDFQADITRIIILKGSKLENYLDINMLKLDAIIQFKDDLSFSTTSTEGMDAQSKKLIPKVKLNTKNMYMVGNVNVEKKSELIIRFCQNYTAGNNYCDTANDTKLLELAIHNQSFNKLLSIKLKEIRMNLEKKVSGTSDVYEISGSCVSLKKAFDPEAVAETYVPVDCVFSGKYSSNPEIGTIINFKYKNKK